MASQNQSAALYEDIERLFAPDNPKPGFGKITTDFQTAIKINYGHGRLEKRTIQTSSMLNDYLDWPGVGQVYRLERKFDWVRQGKVFKSSCEIEYGITSLPNVLPHQSRCSCSGASIGGWKLACIIGVMLLFEKMLLA